MIELVYNSGAPYAQEVFSNQASPYNYQFNRPQGITADSNGNIWVANFNAATAGDIGVVEIKKVQNAYNAVNIPSQTHNQTTTLNKPIAITADSEGTIWVANYENGTVDKIVPDGTSSSPQTLYTDPSYNFSRPYALTADSTGNIWVANSANYTITKMVSAENYDANLFSGVQWGFSNIQDVATDQSGNVWVLNSGNASGTLTEMRNNNNGTYSVVSFPYSEYSINEPAHIAIDSNGNVWVTNPGINSDHGTVVEIEDPNGNPASQVFSSQAYVFIHPNAITADNEGNVWVGGMGSSSPVTELKNSGGGQYTTESFSLNMYGLSDVN